MGVRRGPSRRGDIGRNKIARSHGKVRGNLGGEGVL